MTKTINKIIRSLQIYFSGKLSGKKFIPGIVWFFILFFILCIPGKDLPEGNDWLNKIYFDKWVHVGLFGLLAGLFMAPFFAADLPLKKKWIYVIIIAFGVILWGLATEFIQHAYIEGRSFDLFDWMADTCGTIIAFFLSKSFFLNPRPSFP